MNRPPLSHGPLRRRSVLQAIGAVAVRVAVPAVGVAMLGAAGPAPAADPELTTFEVIRDEDGVYLNYAVEIELGRSVDDALVKSVPLFFVAEAEIFRDRWYWRDRRVAHATRVWKIVYQPLTSTFRVTTVGGLSQTFATRTEAIGSISRSLRWKIAEPGQIEEGSRHYVEFSYRLDITLLPRPMQIGIAGQPDWQLMVKRTQRIN
ncbi:MAG: DUF4390 domain-containing protein [Caldimonas sp.]